MSSVKYNLVIGRQFGSGGREVGFRIAEDLGVPCFDRQLLIKAAVKMGFRPDVFLDADESKPSFFRSMLSLNYGTTVGGTQASPMAAERIYQATAMAIRNIVDEGPCVIVGRTADYILRNRHDTLSVFVYADTDERARRIVERGDAESFQKAQEVIRKRDRCREEYYNYFTGWKWGKVDNYDLCVDTTLLGVEGATKLIKNYLELVSEN